MMAMTTASLAVNLILGTPITPRLSGAIRILMFQEIAQATTMGNTMDPTRRQARAMTGPPDGEFHVPREAMTTAMATPLETATRVRMAMATIMPATMDSPPLPVGITQLRISARRIRERTANETAMDKDRSAAIPIQREGSATMLRKHETSRIRRAGMTMPTTITDRHRRLAATIHLQGNAIRTLA
jgi:hypothetical protein